MKPVVVDITRVGKGPFFLRATKDAHHPRVWEVRQRAGDNESLVWNTYLVRSIAVAICAALNGHARMGGTR